MNSQQHKIDRIRVDISGNDRAGISKAQQQFSFALNTSSFLSQMETLFDKLVPGGEYLEIQTLEIELKDYPENQLQDLLLNEIETCIRQKINSSKNELKILNQETFEREIYTYFLQFGLLRYSSGQNVAERLHQELLQLQNISEPLLESVLKELGTKYPLIWKRLFYAMGREGLLKYCQRVYSYSVQFLEKLVSAILDPETGSAYSQHKINEAELWQQLVPKLINGWPEEKIKAALFSPDETTILSPGTGQQKTIETSVAHRQDLANIINDGIPIANAGMVLLWMEFRQLIRNLEYVVEKNFADTTLQQKAILLFHYIYSGNTDIREEELVLNKLLCGWPLDEPIDPACIPDQNARDTADKMLQDFIEAWRKERKFSVDWFRKTFLEREGLLVKRPDGNWSLEIQKKTEDILITKTSIVKYPWMQEMIFVNW